MRCAASTIVALCLESAREVAHHCWQLFLGTVESAPTRTHLLQLQSGTCAREQVCLDIVDMFVTSIFDQEQVSILGLIKQGPCEKCHGAISGRLYKTHRLLQSVGLIQFRSL